MPDKSKQSAHSWNGSITGYADSIITVLALERKILQSLLPKQLLFGEQQLTGAGLHPVYFAFNIKQQNVSTFIRGFKLRTYSEFVFGIPYLKLEGISHAGYFAFSPFLYLDSLLATIGGIYFYSLPKRLSYLRVARSKDSKGQTTFDASHYLGHENFYFRAEFQKDGCPISSTKSPNFISLEPMLTQPLIVHDAINGFRTTDYKMEGIQNCAIRPVQGIFKAANFISGLSNHDVILPSINDSVLGSFEIGYNWQLTKAIALKK